jgi:hypothetical protein
MDAAVAPVSAVGRHARSSRASRLTPAKRTMSIMLPYGTFWVRGALFKEGSARANGDACPNAV